MKTKLIWITNGSTQPKGSVYKTWVRKEPKAMSVEELKEQGMNGYYVEKWEVDKFKKKVTEAHNDNTTTTE